MKEPEIKINDRGGVEARFENGGFKESGSIQDYLLLRILDKLDDIHAELVNIESGVKPR